MGQEASVHRNGGDPDEVPTTDQTPASPPRAGAGRTTAFGDKAGANPNVAASAAPERPPPGEIPNQQPQSHQHLPRPQPHAAGTSAVPPPRHPRIAAPPPPPPPPPQHQQHGEPPSSSSSSISMMSRAGLSSMFQRAVSVSSGGIGGGSGHGSSRKAGKGSGQQRQQQQHQQQHQQVETTPNNTSNHIHHQDLSPESKARQQATMMKKQEQQQQQQQQQQRQQRQTKPTSTHQYSSLDAMHSGDGHQYATSSANGMLTSNRSGADYDNVVVVAAASSMVQGMTNLNVSPQRPSSSQHSKPTTPPSPRALLLEKMQNNDEEDWEKAWAEDSEDSDEDGDATPKRGNNIIAVPAIAGVAPTIPYLKPNSAIAVPILPHRLPSVEGSDQAVAAPTSISSAHSAFVPTKPPPQEQPLDDRYQQQQHQQANDASSLPDMLRTPIFQYPPIRPESHYLSPEHPSTQRDVDEDARLLREANEALQDEEVGEDGRRYDWNSYIREGIAVDGGEKAEDERPCVSMFDPALRVLGRGSFGRVVLVQKQRGRGAGTLYAMKILRKSHLVRRRQIERTKTERKVLSMLDHPFIMKMYYAFQTPDKLYLVLDYCPGGELFFHLSRYRRFQEPVARFYAAELLLAIGHLHKHGILYRDLKPENVLLDAYGHVKLGDFGLAKDGIRHPTQGAKSTCGTPEYMAPEVLNQSGHGFCVDYWGLGMILFEMMTGLPPWYTTDRSKLFRRLKSAPLVFPMEVHFSPHCKACIAGLLEREPRMRLGVMGLRSAMRHEFFYRRINFDALRARQIAAPIRPCEAWRQFNKSNSVAGYDSEHQQQSLSSGDGGVGGWNDASPSLDGDATGSITLEALDVATANFDDSFRRMPIETEDYERQQQAAGHPPISESELNSQTFRGFTFDGEEGDLPPTKNDNQTHYYHPSGKPPP